MFSPLFLTRLLRVALRVFECYDHEGSEMSSVVSYPEVLCDASDDAYLLPLVFAIANLLFLLALFPLQAYFIWHAPQFLMIEEWRDASQFLIERFRPRQFW